MNECKCVSKKDGQSERKVGSKKVECERMRCEKPKFNSIYFHLSVRYENIKTNINQLYEIRFICYIAFFNNLNNVEIRCLNEYNIYILFLFRI